MHKHKWQLLASHHSYGTPYEDDYAMEFNFQHIIFACECGEYKINKGKTIVVKDYYKRTK